MASWFRCPRTRDVWLVMRGCLHTARVKPVPPDTFVLCRLPPSHLLTFAGAAPGAGWLLPPGCPLPRTAVWVASPSSQDTSPHSSGAFAPGLERPWEPPDSSSSFQFVLFSNSSYLWLRLFYKCHLRFLKIHLRVTLHELMLSGGGEEARLRWCAVRPRIVFLWSHRPGKERPDLQFHSRPHPPSAQRALGHGSERFGLPDYRDFLFLLGPAWTRRPQHSPGTQWEWTKSPLSICYGLKCILPKFLCWSPTPLYLRTWLYWEVGPLKMHLS